MKQDTHINQLFEQAVDACLTDAPDAGQIETAARRVWQRIEAAPDKHGALELTAMSDNHNYDFLSDTSGNTKNLASQSSLPIKSCADFQVLIPAYLNHQLTDARRTLFEDHTGACVPCRRALKDARAGVSEQRVAGVESWRNAPAFIRQASGSTFGASLGSWRIAAAITVACLLLAGWFAWQPIGKSSLDMTVEAASGALYPVENQSAASLEAGSKVKAGERVRTAKDASASFSLPDGSRVEMRERSQMFVTNSSDGATINLERGQIIVEAAKQRENNRLYVRTPDALVAVKGTIFSVNSGTTGARVAVIEGAVELASSLSLSAGKAERTLRAGEQATTRPELKAASLNDEIAWSARADKYKTLLNEAAQVGKEIDARVSLPGKRYSTRLLDLTLPRTVFYAALPNAGTQLADSYDLLQTRLNENPALKEWWNARGTNSDAKNAKPANNLNFIFARLRGWGAQLGDEIAISASIGAQGQPDAPLLLAEIKDENAFRRFFESEIAALQTQSGKPLKIRFINESSDIADTVATGDNQAQSKNEIFVLLHNNIFATSTSENAVRALADNNSSDQARNAFLGRIADVYRNGTNFVLAADLKEIINNRTHAPRDEQDKAMFHESGFDDLQFLIVESDDVTGNTADEAKRIENRATVTFAGARRGIASWLGAPNAMGALDYISSEASFASVFVMKQPAMVVDDLLTTLRAVNPDAMRNIEDAQLKTGINVREDLAAPLGGEFAFAVDGALLPVPSWKLIVEVYDPARLQAALMRVVEAANEQARLANKPGIELTTSELNGQTYYTLKSAQAPVEINYTFANRYFIAAPSRALVDRALNIKSTGMNIRQAPRFRDALPQGSDPNFSALVYQNLGSVIDTFAPYAERLTNDKNVSADKVAALASRVPALAYAQAYDDRIVFALPTQGAPFGLTPSALLGLPAEQGGESFGLNNVIEANRDNQRSPQ